MDLSKRYQNLDRRRIDPAFKGAIKLSNALEKSDKKGPISYIVGAMQAVDVRSTNTLFEQAERIFNQLENPAAEAALPIVQQLQGSVTNNTHIRYYSDIDLLTLISDSKFTSIQAPLVINYPYSNGKQDLYDLRELEVSVLKKAFYAAKVDDTKPKSIKVSGGSLKGPVDVVPCNWVDTKEWVESNNLIHRGIKILDAHTGERIVNFPFKHNYFIDQKNKLTLGNSNKLIRFLKTLIADSKDDGVKIDVSSYDVCGLVYNMPNQSLFYSEKQEILLLNEFIQYANKLIIDQISALKLDVPNGTRKLFETDGLSFLELHKLNVAVKEIYNEAIGLNSILTEREIRNFYSLIG